MGAWLAWLNFLKRLRESDVIRKQTSDSVIAERQRKDTSPVPENWQQKQVMHTPIERDNSWRVPYDGRGYDDDMKDWRG